MRPKVNGLTKGIPSRHELRSRADVVEATIGLV